MTPDEVRDSGAMMLVLIANKQRRPCRVVNAHEVMKLSHPVRVVAYEINAMRWRTYTTTADQVEQPTPADSDRVKAAHESLSWMFIDESCGKLRTGSAVMRHEADAVRGVDDEDHTDQEQGPDGVVLNVSKRRGQVQVAWLLQKRR